MGVAPPPPVAPPRAPASFRAVRLQRWLFQLGGWLEPGQEGVVLCPEADGLPGDFVRTLRLRRWIFELGGRLEPGQEGVVLRPEADGLPRVRAIRLRCWIPPLHALFGGVFVSTDDRLLLQELPQML